MKEHPFQNEEVEFVFDQYPLDIRSKLMFLRSLILDVPSRIKEVGNLEETLRWSEPAYITSETKSGSLIRIHHYPSKAFDYAMYFHCGTNLVETFRGLFPDCFKFGGNRAIQFMLADAIPVKELNQCIELALTTNLQKMKEQNNE